ncbi:MAG: serine protease [Gammaproteobacteria bacterium SG8_11]|nr:MAG: serine protease [Gammaproteobacteria bacterium SG8_11]
MLSVARTSDGFTSAANKAVFITITGAIGPATKDYFIRSLDKAVNRGAKLFIVQMNTPGGLDSSMRDINQVILASTIPVVSYVAPSGARAASAGTYILYASHIAAMAPATNLGAATPVQIGGGGLPGGSSDGRNDKNQEPDKKPTGESRPVTAPTPSKDAMSRKAINDAVAYIQGLAELRGRNKEWAEKAVREAASLSANDALQYNVIDLIADNMSELLKQLHGKSVNISGQERILDTQGIILEQIEPDWRNRLLSILTDPNVAYILMLIGIYGLIFEFSNPGAMIPGIMGAISLLLALYAFQVLPINYAGFALILLGIVLMIAEAFVPSFGALGIGGVIAFVIGSVILMDTDVPGFGVSLPLIASFALVSSALFTLVLIMALKARRRPVVSGQEQLIGAIAEVLKDFDRNGVVHLHGENWSAFTTTPLKQGDKVQVTKMEGLTLWVEPYVNSEEEKSS